MKQINLNDYFQKDKTEMRLCNSPEEIAATEKINQAMRIVQRQARSMFAQSAQLARHFCFTR